MALRLVAYLFCPFLTDAALSTGLTALTTSNFDDFIRRNQKVMIDFVRGSDHTDQLVTAVKLVRRNGNNVPFGRVDVDKHPELATRYFSACSEEKQQCSVQFPQLLWFVNGHASQYHRSLTESQHIASFVLAMDRDLVASVASSDDALPWSRYVLLRGERDSDMYRTLEHVAARHMDTVAVAHLEEAGSNNLSFIVNGTVNDTFGDTPDEDSVERWVRHHLLFSEDAPEKVVDDDGSVIVVASTFEELVLRNDSDVFLFVYAPWCGFSRKVLPEWSKFAKNLTQLGTKSLVAAKMDGSENSIETQEYKWKSFPTLVYFRAGSQTPLYYEGERTVEGFLTFARHHGSRAVSALATDDSIVLMQTSTGAKYREAMGDYMI